MPFTAAEPHLVLESLERWAQAGRACSSGAEHDVDFLLLNSRDETLLDVDLFMSNLTRSTFMRTNSRCFGAVELLHSRLSAERDEYPAGPSNMFFDLFLSDDFAAFRRSYDFMFWTEWDTKPIKPFWVDCLQHETGTGEFWVKGSMLQGPHLDIAVQDRVNWNWVAHINGNALYSLRNPAFRQFLRVVIEYEPPNHYWKPFDVSMWRVLHAFPYTWPLYQRYRPMFLHSAFIRHYSFLMSEKNEEDAVASQHTFFVHGAAASAGKVIYEKKIVNASLDGVQWDDAIMAELSISVLMRSHRADMRLALVALESIRRYMPSVAEVVVVVPEGDVAAFTRRIPYSKVLVRGEPDLLQNGRMQQKYTKLTADQYCKGKFVFHLDSDVVLFRPVQTRDLFWAGKPLLFYDAYDNLPRVLDIWRQGTANAVGKPIEHEFSRSNNHLYPRSMYAQGRRHLEELFKTNLTTFLKTRLAATADAAARHMSEQQAAGLYFSDFNYLGGYLWHFMHDAIAWAPMDGIERDRLAFPAPIVPAMTCQGDARLAVGTGMLTEQVAALRAAVNAGSCDPVLEFESKLLAAALALCEGDLCGH
jgi:hypothetical protein